MIDRETLLHGTFAIGAFVAYVAVAKYFDVTLRSPAGAILSAVANVVVLGGLTHTVLAVRRSGGSRSALAGGTSSR